MPSLLPVGTASPIDLEPFAGVQLIVADLDGTLLDPMHSVIDLIQSAIPRLRRRGVRFTIATGRAFRGVATVLPRLGLTGSMPLALYNGSLCIDAARRNVLYSRTISAAISARVVAWGLSLGRPVLCYPELANSMDGLHETPMGFLPDGNPALYAEPNGYEVTWLGPSDVNTVPNCHAILIDLRASNNVVSTPFDAAGVTITQSGSQFLEIRPNGCDKGTAVAAIIRRLQLSSSAVLAIGDNDNDIEMLTSAGVGVAVGNASPNLQSVASYATSLPAAQGCLQIIRLVIAARRYATVARSRAGGQRG